MNLRSLSRPALPCPCGQAIFAGNACVSCAKPVAATPYTYDMPQRRNTGRQLGRPRSYDLTPKEHEIATLLAYGATQKQIAEQLGLCRAAVSSSIGRAMTRIGAVRPHELVRHIRRQRESQA